MASLPSQHPNLSLHLTDLSLTPLITSSSSRTHLESLTSLTSSAITSQTAVQRANLGKPQRIMVEYPDSGAVVLQSFLDPRESGGGSGASSDPEPGKDDDGRLDDGVPALVSVVVAGSPEEAREARRAAARLERVGKEFQKEWVAQGMDRGGDGTDTPE
ncbi:hypothetical protein PT974_11675 [Cladobotryum mycophilum]|uniref:EKC/KEOPS complex subunit CGI121 n=1 Tax=Cladobotryum mycophilum TaxID=491253 RepID=A0ABR0S5W3_9HYPO